MKKALVVAAVVATVASSAPGVEAKKPKAHQLSHAYTFAHYVKDFGKRYASGEYKHREGLFKQELGKVLTHNADKTQLWRMGVNHMSDWTPEEKAKMYKGARPKDGHVPELKVQPGEHKVSATGVPLPYSVDWRLANPAVLTAVKDQGQCGSCWAHATAEGVEAANMLSSGERMVLSQQQIASCTSTAQGCDGGWPKVAWSYVISSGGLNEEWVQGYVSYNGVSPNCSALPINLYQAPVLGVISYNEVARNDADAFADALAKVGPLSIIVDASSWSPYESGIFTGCTYDSNFGLDHAVQAVGYGTDAALGHQYWIVRNSWNAGWGEEGYIRLLREPTGQSNCGWVVGPTLNTQNQNVTVCGMCGLYMEALYGVTAPSQ